eukprot:m51a1_g11168 putative xyloglucanase (854) ;mRNA; f:300524-303317
MRSLARSLCLAACAATLGLCASQQYKFKPVYTGGGGGFIVDVVFHPKQKDLIYAKTDMGGAYRWEPTTSKWTQLFNFLTADEWNWSGMESLALDPQDPNLLYVAGGTYTNSWAGSYSDGNGCIWISKDKGASFSRVIMPFKMGGNMPGRGMGERLAVDPNLGSILYFGARDGKGLWKSTDSGKTWTNVANFPDMGPFCGKSSDSTGYLSSTVGIPWVVFDPASGTKGSATKTIYVGVANNNANKPSIYRSTDAGATWAAVPGQPTCSGTWGGTVTCTDGRSWTAGSENAYSGGGLGYLPHSAKFDSNGTLYVTYSDWEGPYNGGHGAVFKFDGSWHDITPCTKDNSYCTLGSLYYGFGGLGVDAQKPGTVVVAGVNAWWPQGVMFRTTNAGASWTPAWQYTSYPTVSQVFAMNITNAPWLNFGKTESPPVPAVNIGHMMEGLNIDPFDSDRMMYGTGATLYCAYNLQKWDSGSGVVIKSEARGIEEASVLGLVSPPATGLARLYSVMGDIGGFRHDDLNKAPNAMYTVPYAGTMNAIDFAESNPRFLVRVGTGDPSASPATYGSAFTYDGGNTWFQGNKDPVSGQGAGTVAAAADASRVLWAGTAAAPAWSSDNGNSWTVSTGLPTGAAVASDRVNAKKFYGIGSGKFYVSTDAAATFTASSASGFPSSGATVRAVFGTEGDVWVAGGSDSGLWHTTDSGATFTKLTTLVGAAQVGFGKAAEGKSYPAVFVAGRLASGGATGIFRSDDAGASWVQISDAQHNYATVQTLTGDPTIYGRVYFGTNGLGAVYGDIAGSATSSSTAATASSAKKTASSTKTTPVDSDGDSGLTGDASLPALAAASIAIAAGAVRVL